jgi:glycosyltransferase involved in cell wall biosynthesis
MNSEPIPMLLGPAAPADLAALMFPQDAAYARDFDGSRGTPVTELARALIEAGRPVEICTLTPGLDGPVTFEGPMLKMTVLPRRSRARHVVKDLYRAERRQIEAVLKRSDAEVIHAHWTYEFAWAASTDRRPLIVTAHDSPLTVLRHQPDAYRAVRALVAIIVRSKLGTLTAVSPYLRLRWQREMLYRGPIEVIPNMVRTPADQSSPRDDNSTVILDVTNSGRLKNVSTLLAAMKTVRKNHPGAVLRLIGPGLTDDSDLARRAVEIGVRDVTEFIGEVPFDRLSSEYRTAAVFAHPSREESFGLALAEAMANGLPVIGGRDSGAVPWLLDEGRAGRLTDVTLGALLATEVESMLAAPEARAELGEAGRVRVASEFSPDKIVARWLEKYDEQLRSAR